MSARFAPYAEYGTETVQLLGNFPKGWTATPIKVIGNLGGGAGFPHDEQGRNDQAIEFHKVNSLGAADLQNYISPSENTISLETAQRLRARVFPEQTIVFAKVGAALLLSRFRWLRRPACLDNNMMGLEVRRMHNPGFVKYALGTLPMGYVVNPGAVPSVNEGGVGNLRLPIPALDEQTQIAKFLDYETAKIDQLIDKQQQLIALLKEKRQAVISHAVTKGLDPKAPMKDSGVEWLGEVPAHWEVARLKFLVSHVVDCHHSTPKYDSEAPWPALRTADVSPGRLDIAGARRVHTGEYLERISRLKPRPGDVIYSREGERWGMAALVPDSQEVCLAQRVMLFRAGCEVIPAFLMWALNSESVYNQLAVDVVGATSPHVNIGDIREAWIALPPTPAQESVVAHLADVLGKLDRLDDQAAILISILQERRTALISAAVTGKIDVRNWHPPKREAIQEVA